MQTFLPYVDFRQSAKALDNKRLGKQRVEVLQILQTINKRNRICPKCKRPQDNSTCALCQEQSIQTPWYNHPAVRMWRGYTLSLAQYGWYICQEWIDRGFKDTCKFKILNEIGNQNILMAIKPPWVGCEEFHASHRSNLLRKDPIYYSRFGWKESSDLPYIWPVKKA